MQKSYDNKKYEGQQFGNSEEIIYPCGIFDTNMIYESKYNGDEQDSDDSGRWQRKPLRENGKICDQ